MAIAEELAKECKELIQDPDQSGEENDEDYVVLKMESESETSKPYYMEGLINGNKFKTIIDTGSPVTIFELDEIKQIMKS